MADKKITELQLISAVTDDTNIPGDTGIQTFRLTATQLKAYILATGNVPASALSDTFVHDLTAVTPAGADYLPVADASDSNKKKKVLLSSIKNSVYRGVATTDTAGVDDGFMVLSGASFTQTLPTAVGVAGKKYTLVHGGTSLTQVYTIATTSAQVLKYGGHSIASAVLKMGFTGDILEIMSDGSDWVITNLGIRVTSSATRASWAPGNGAVMDINSIQFDPQGWITTGASWKFLPKIAGWYEVHANGACSAASVDVQMYRNGGSNNPMMGITAGAAYYSGYQVVALNGSTDYIDFRINSNATLNAFWCTFKLLK